ncbi:lithocholate 6-beta-hydroxylase-like isoform X5 [Parasteatoda tepidariorum]|uniref:lithocholate 6-beta-hydroxylase-like isoform X5 n=1 Tax=Parasteatoda tepidariorum TaxID=114398 RepID=UPI0039BC8C6F
MALMEIFSGPLFATFLIGVSTFLLALWYSMKKQSYWKERNVPYVKPLPFLGSLLDNVTMTFQDQDYKRYNTLGPIYGVYEVNSPTLSVADPKLLRDILVKDFANFPNRRSFITGNKIGDNMLPSLEGEDWKRVRTIITPTFTTGKLKRLMSIFKDCAKTLSQNFKMSEMKKEPIDAKRLFGAFTMDVIASSAFSTKLDSHNDPENTFVRYARAAFSTKISWRMLLFLLAPKLMSFFKMSVSNPTVTNFFSEVTAQIIAERKRTKQTRNDFLQLLMDTAEETYKSEKKDDVDDDDIAAKYGQDFVNQTIFNTSENKNLSTDELVAQCVIFFLAGYETTATLLTYVLYCLALNGDIQEKSYQEITQCLKETNGELTYEALHNMKYLDNIISETLRLYPPGVRAERKVASEYKLGDTGITLEKDIIVSVPIFAIHRDPKYYPNPEKFDPDRFSAKEIAKRDSYVYLPFGHGPRNCVGMRFALLEAKVCLVYIISCFKTKPCDKTPVPMKFNHNAFGILQPKDVFLATEIRKDCLLKP